MKRSEEFSAYFQKQLPSTLELLQQMVGINSFTTNKDGVRKLSAFTAKTFTGLGFKAETVPSVRSDYGDHLVLTRKGRSKKIIGLISHLDTVFPPEEEQRNNFKWKPVGDKIYGPGTMDIKGGTAMIHLVLSGLQKLAPESFNEITWVILLNSSEEVFSPDFGELCLKRFGKNALAALVFEAGVRDGNTFSLVTARKGRAAYEVKAEGRGAHAGGRHERGANAVVQLAHTVQEIAALTNYKKALTFNVGMISGGTVINRVPHEATALGEMRAFDRTVFNAGVKKLLALSKKSHVRSAEDGHRCRVHVKIKSESPPWPRNEGTERLLKIFQSAGKEAGLKVLREERGGISDGNFICHSVPTLDGLGPHGDNDHCSETSADGSKEAEYVDAASFVPKATLNALAILKLVES